MGRSIRWKLYASVIRPRVQKSDHDACRQLTAEQLLVVVVEVLSRNGKGLANHSFFAFVDFNGITQETLVNMSIVTSRYL